MSTEENLLSKAHGFIISERAKNAIRSNPELAIANIEYLANLLVTTSSDPQYIFKTMKQVVGTMPPQNMMSNIRSAAGVRLGSSGIVLK